MLGFRNDRARRRLGGDGRLARTVAVAVAGALVTGIVIGLAPPTATADTVVVIDGRGFGHGVGMAQDGAYWMGKSGRTATDILKLFYPGTTVTKQGGPIRVPLLSVGSLTIAFPNGGRIGDQKVDRGAAVSVRTSGGGLVTTLGLARPALQSESAEEAPSVARSVALEGRGSQDGGDVEIQLIAARTAVRAAVNAQQGEAAATDPNAPIVLVPATTTIVPAPTIPASATTDTPAAIELTPPPPEPITPTVPDPSVSDTTAASSTELPDGGETADTTPTQPVPKLRVTAAAGGLITIGSKKYRGTLELTAGGGIRVVNELDVEDYLRGMGEILSREWPAATLQAQAIAARTYAFRTMAAAGEVCPTQRCQVYLGAQVEYPEMDAAVVATRGKVLAYKGRLATTFYSASGGGTIATPTEAFGGNGKDLPYLKAGVYPTGDVKAWTVRMSMAEVGRRLGYPGALRSIQVTTVGPSGRATEVTLDGSGGNVRLGGPKVDAALGLRSTFFTVRTEIGSVGVSDATAGEPGSNLPGGVVDLGAQSDLLATDDPLIVSADANDATDTTSAATDTSMAASADTSVGTNTSTETATDPDSTPDSASDSVTAVAQPLESTLAPAKAGAAHRDRGFDLMLGSIVATAVLIAIALFRRNRT